MKSIGLSPLNRLVEGAVHETCTTCDDDVSDIFQRLEYGCATQKRCSFPGVVINEELGA